MRGEELVGLGFKPGPVRRQISKFLIPARTPLVERRVDLGGKVAVVIFADRDVGVGVRYEPFRDLHGHGTAGAGGLLRSPA
ncbi:hypothetical protein [Miniimonas sp. S16]|uniref:hypothetical protein n=1 Tax=Miniimonas sp. S16 TaxID=2171623 RepID=UPI001F42FAFE|nr:hypothetical protein [Miniimonas sp. S16]